MKDYFPSTDRLREKEYELQMQIANYHLDLGEWQLSIMYDEYLQNAVIELCRLVAEIDEPVDEKYGIEYFPRTEHLHYSVVHESVWDMIKFKWLRLFRSHWGLTAPFWQPKFDRRSLVHHYTAEKHVYVTRTYKKIVAQPGTRRYREVNFDGPRLGTP